MTSNVVVREVGLRDGLQLVRHHLPTDKKIAWCRQEASAGVREIEITSFVSPAVVPQFKDAEAVAAETFGIDGLLASALVPNLKGAQRAFENGISKVNFVLSASEAHNQANVRKSTAESMDEFRRIVEERNDRVLDVKVASGIATTFGCTIQGDVSEDRVVEIAEGLLEAGADELIIADTVGYGNPAQVRRIMSRIVAIATGRPVFAHFHDTRGLGLANVVAALDVGVTHFDASLGGLGGCPFAPGASGNINIEDCVFLLEAMGLRTGINLDELLEIRRTVESWLPAERFSGALARAGLPRPTAGST